MGLAFFDQFIRVWVRRVALPGILDCLPLFDRSRVRLLFKIVADLHTPLDHSSCLMEVLQEKCSYQSVFVSSP